MKVTSPSGSNSMAVLRAVRQELDTVMSGLWRSQGRTGMGVGIGQQFNRFLHKNQHQTNQNNQTSRLSVPTLVKLAGLGLGLLLLLRDWHLGLALGSGIWGMSVLIKLSPSQRLRLWQQVQQAYAKQPLPILLGAGILAVVCLGDAAEGLLPWLCLGAVVGFGVGKAKSVVAPATTPSVTTLPVASTVDWHPPDWQLWVQTLATPEPLQRLLAVQHIQEWLTQDADAPPITPQRGRFLVRALQLRLQQEPEVMVQQAILEAIDVLEALNALNSSPQNPVGHLGTPPEISQLPAVSQAPLNMTLAQKRRPPAYQSQAQMEEIPYLQSF